MAADAAAAAAASEAPRRAPAEPLVVVLGATGTGKSELAVELATRFRGEIINADAMQLYEGLPILTNKMPVAERRGVPHHLLGHISAGDAPWDVDAFKRAATALMADIRRRGRLPILVGGTHYYVDPLLFPDVILDDVVLDRGDDGPAAAAASSRPAGGPAGRPGGAWPRCSRRRAEAGRGRRRVCASWPGGPVRRRRRSPSRPPWPPPRLSSGPSVGGGAAAASWEKSVARGKE
ncbi:hypothetical protein CDD83_1891 [Cordyceps sp. RAO-2017]|nr:hypothetical protein CDD83_1891 [Cordyceps sp. RAO-2017]